VYKSVSEKHRYNPALVNYAQSSNSKITGLPKNDIYKPQYISSKRSIRSIMKYCFKTLPKLAYINIIIDNNQYQNTFIIFYIEMFITNHYVLRKNQKLFVYLDVI